MKKVVLYSHSPVVGGVLRHMEALAAELKRQGLDILAVLNSDPRIDDFAVCLAAAGVRVERAVATGWRDVRRLAAWRRLLGREQPDLVHFHQCAPHENVPAILLTAGCRIPVVLTEHLPFWSMSESRLRRVFKRIVLWFVHAVVLLGPSLIEPYIRTTGIRRTKIRAIPPFSFLVPALTRSWGSVVGFIGEFSERKGVHHLIAMTPQLIAAGYRLRIFGHGEFLDRLRAFAEEWDGAVKISSFNGDPRQALARIDALLLLSSHEGLPLVILEAVSAGVPVLTTKVGVIADYFADGEGLYYLDGTDGDRVLVKLRQLQDGEMRRHMVCRGQARLQAGLTPPALTQQLLELYRQARRERDGH